MGRGRGGAESVVLAAGGFEADPELRQRHLGEGWQRAKVREHPLETTGDLLTAALAAGAAPHGDWGSCTPTAACSTRPARRSRGCSWEM